MVRVFFIYFYSIVGEICEEYYIYVFDIYNIAFKIFHFIILRYTTMAMWLT